MKKHKPLCKRILIDDGITTRAFYPFEKNPEKRWYDVVNGHEKPSDEDLMLDLDGIELFFSQKDGFFYDTKYQRFPTSIQQKARNKLYNLIEKSNPQIQGNTYSGKLISQVCNCIFRLSKE